MLNYFCSGAGEREEVFEEVVLIENRRGGVVRGGGVGRGGRAPGGMSLGRCGGLNIFSGPKFPPRILLTDPKKST